MEAVAQWYLASRRCLILQLGTLNSLSDPARPSSKTRRLVKTRPSALARETCSRHPIFMAWAHTSTEEAGDVTVMRSQNSLGLTLLSSQLICPHFLSPALPFWTGDSQLCGGSAMARFREEAGVSVNAVLSHERLGRGAGSQVVQTVGQRTGKWDTCL